MLPKKIEYLHLWYDEEANAYYADAFHLRYVLPAQQYALLQAADGKTDLSKVFPEYSKRRLAFLLRGLKAYGLIVTSRIQGFLVARLTLLRIANRVKLMQGFCGIINLLLPFAAVLSLCFGPYYFCDCFANNGMPNIALCCVLFVVSVIAHEFGHFVAGVCYRYYVIDTGLLLLFRIIPIGAYVAFARDNRARKTRHKLQFHLAGCEMNMLLANVFAVLSATSLPVAGEFSLAAIINWVLALFNAIPCPGIDGGDAFASIFGIDYYPRFVLDSLKGHRRLIRSGAAGRLCLAVALVGAVSMAVFAGIIISDTVTLVEDVAILISF